MATNRFTGGLPNLTQATIALVGSPTYLGRITVAGASLNNSTTAAPFTLTPGSLLLCAASADMQWLPGTTSSAAVTTTNGVPQTIAVDGKKWLVWLRSDQSYLAVIGTGNVDVWALD